MIPTTTMQLPKPETGDPMEPFFLGTQPDGGYWMTVTRLSEHDHTGGLLGKPITAATIPDGSITTSKLDPAVLAPYAPTDGSKPFSGQVTMQADAVLRDELLFGEQGTALAPDVHLRRTGVGALRLDTNLGVGVAPAAWGAGWAHVAAGTGHFVGHVSLASASFRVNSYYDGTSDRAVIAGPGVDVNLSNGQFQALTAPAVAAGAVQTFTPRLTVSPAGALGVGVAPAAWHPARRAVQVGDAATLVGWSGAPGLELLHNSVFGADAVSRPLSGGQPASRVEMSPGGPFLVATAPAVGAGAAQTFTTRAQIAQTGTLTLTPDAGQPHLVSLAGSNLTLRTQAGGSLVLGEGATDKLSYDANRLYPLTDNQVALGVGSNRYTVVYAVAGAINTSAAEIKQDIAPLAPADALAAVLATDPVTFTYTAPAPTAEQYELPDDPEQAEAVLHDRLVNAPLLEAARSQAGFVLQDATGTYQTDPLFETGFGQSNAANSAGILLAALHEIDRRLTAGGL